MKFNEKLLKLRKEKRAFAGRTGEWKCRYRDRPFQNGRQDSHTRTSLDWLCSVIFDMTLDELVKDIDVQEVRENSLTNEKIDSIYRVSQEVDSIFQNKRMKDIIKGIKWFIVGSCIFVCLVMIISLILHLVYPEAGTFWRTY